MDLLEFMMELDIQHFLAYSDVIVNRIRYFTSVKSGITYIFSHYFTKIKVDSYNSLHTEKILTLHNVHILHNQF